MHSSPFHSSAIADNRRWPTRSDAAATYADKTDVLGYHIGMCADRGRCAAAVSAPDDQPGREGCRVPDILQDIVIGSGPAALAVIVARLDKGRKVTVIDAGKVLEPDNDALRRSLGAVEPEAWDTETIVQFRQRQLAIPGGIGRFGSTFALRAQADVVCPEVEGVQLQSSHALGGMSNFWGSAVLPWAAGDLVGWPIDAHDLAPHYAAAADLLNVAGIGAAYDAVLGSAALVRNPPLPATRQGRELVERLRPWTAPDGARFWPGMARLAAGPDCRACGLCLYGCPYGQIFTAAKPIADLREAGRIAYVRAEAVRLRSGDGHVAIELADGRPAIEAARVFVATGVLETARLLFASDGDLAERGITLSDSRHMFTPFLHRWSAGDPAGGPHHTLATAFVEFRDHAVSPHLVHSQLYCWNDFYAREMATKYMGGRSALSSVFRRLARRLIVAQTFLHSDHCDKIILRPAIADPMRRLMAERVDAPGYDDRAARARRTLTRYLRRAGLYRIPGAGHVGPPGSSFHLGASLPMSDRPGRGETDILGRPAGLANVHVVDASVMPAIPASTITMSVMANAHRIAVLA